MRTSRLYGLLLSLFLGAPAWAVDARLCVFDLQGTTGEMFNASKDYALAMQATGVTLELKAYTDERVAVEDFRTGQCQAVLASTFRTRAFNPVTASTDAFGATLILRNGQVDAAAGHAVVKMASTLFASPAATDLVVQGRYEMAGLIDVGAVYAVLRDRSMITPEALAGKRILAFDHDKAQAYMIQKAGAQAVSADITTFANKFNNGMADMAAAPAIAFKPLELLLHMGPKGAVCRFPYMIMSYQLIIDRTHFPAAFAPASRRYWLKAFDEVMARITRAEREVPAQDWLDLPPEYAPHYAEFLRQVRVDLAERGIYNEQGLKLLKRIRCKVAPDAADCATDSELHWPDMATTARSTSPPP